MSGTHDWLRELRFGSPLHFATVGWCALVMALFVILGRRASRPEGERRLRRAWAIGIFVLAAALLTRAFWPSTFDPRYTLPLHLCDVAFPLAAFALWSQARTLRALTYFWAFALSTQAFVTPVISRGPGHLEYWAFWVYHVQLVGAALYDVIVRGFRPTGRDFLTAVAGLLLYGLVVIPINVAFGWGYGFIGPDDSLGAGTVLEYLPAWPWRPVAIFAIATGGMAVVWLVWPAARRARGLGDRSRHPSDGDGSRE